MKRVVPVLLLAGSVVACGPRAVGPEVTSTPDPTAGPVKSWPKSSSTVSTSPSPVKSADQLAAEEVVTEYFRLKNIVKKDPEADLEPLQDIVVGDLLENELALFEQDRENNVVQTGDFLFVIHGSRRQDDGTVQVSACTDASQIDLVDRDTGESVLDPNRPFVKEWSIQTTQFGKVWKVSDLDTKDADQCAL
ncbi:hypothetical protein EII34_08090 [Arachnia propionica]|uniref:Lipoprotein n=1 Tax=Arachnia propionica TaxID=1750 RepID=A0A3P1T671_9ACTN|nr:hypothetical protein [Arachnia propionica]RRD04879.1 hypothetical protein EII34_08090 [Arachnia propionica]